jgi:hypothetical protein
MDTTPQIDLQQEACKGLAQLSHETKFVKLLINEMTGFFPQLLSLLQSNDSSIVHNIAVLLYNLLGTNSPSFQQNTFQYLIPSIIEIMKQPLNYVNKDTIRFLSGCVLLLSVDGNPRNLSPYTETLSHYRQCGDERIQHNVVSTLEMIRSC